MLVAFYTIISSKGINPWINRRDNRGYKEVGQGLLAPSLMIRRLLDSLCEMNADGFWTESKKVNDRYNVCGFSALACLLEILPLSQGHLLDYGVFQEEATQSAVSFASVLFVN
jgi:hypothetical protein